MILYEQKPNGEKHLKKNLINIIWERFTWGSTLNLLLFSKLLFDLTIGGRLTFAENNWPSEITFSFILLALILENTVFKRCSRDGEIFVKGSDASEFSSVPGGTSLFSGSEKRDRRSLCGLLIEGKFDSEKLPTFSGFCWPKLRNPRPPSGTFIAWGKFGNFLFWEMGGGNLCEGCSLKLPLPRNPRPALNSTLK